MKKISVSLAMAVFTIVLAWVSEAAAPLKAIVSRDDPAGKKGHTRFRFVNAIPDSSPLDLWIGRESMIGPMPYGAVSEFVDFVNGPGVPSLITVVQSGTAGPVLAAISTPCSYDCDTTLIAAGSMNAPSLKFIWGPTGAPPAGQALVGFFQASPDIPMAAVNLDGALGLFSYWEFAEGTKYVAVPAGTHNVEFVDMDRNTVALTMPVSFADGGVYTVYLTGLRADTSALSSVHFIPVAAHTDGLNGSQWRSDLGLLNPGGSAANVEIRFFGSDGVTSNTVQVPAGAQSILTDVVGQLGAEGQGAVEVLTDQPLKLTARTYTQTAPDAGCFPGGTHGQEYPVLSAGDGLGAGQSAHLPGLVENAGYRSNIGVVSTDADGATVLVELYDGAGTKLAEYTVGLAFGQWAQENRPFETKAGQTAMDRGYARVTVQSGSGVWAFASVIDNVTNDPTNVAMQR